MRTFICLGTGRLKTAGLLAAHSAHEVFAAAALALVSDHAPAGTCTHMLSHATPSSEEKGAVMICIPQPQVRLGKGHRQSGGYELVSMHAD